MMVARFTGRRNATVHSFGLPKTTAASFFLLVVAFALTTSLFTMCAQALPSPRMDAAVAAGGGRSLLLPQQQYEQQQQQQQGCEEVLASIRAANQELDGGCDEVSTAVIKKSLASITRFIANHCPQQQQHGDNEQEEVTINNNNISQIEEDQKAKQLEREATAAQQQEEPQEEGEREQHQRQPPSKDAVVVVSQRQQQQRRRQRNNSDDNSHRSSFSPMRTKKGKQVSIASKSEKRHASNYMDRTSNVKGQRQENKRLRSRRETTETQSSGEASRCIVSSFGTVNCDSAVNPTELTLTIDDSPYYFRPSDFASSFKYSSSVETLIVRFERAIFSANTPIPPQLWSDLNWTSLNRLELHAINGRVEFYTNHTLENLADLVINIQRPQFTDNSLLPLASQLTRLEIRDANSLASLPKTLFQGMTQLRSLSITAPSLTAIHQDTFQGLSALERLSITVTAVISLPPTIFDDLSSLEELDLRNNRLIGLPSGIFKNLNHLTYLDVFNNNIATIADDIFPLNSSIATLYMENNKISSLTNGVFQGLSQLQYLDLYNNRLTTLSQGVFHSLQRLFYLDLHNNFLTSLPKGVFDSLISLEHLNLHNNRLAQIPPNLFDSLTSLGYLDLWVNRLTSLPEGIFHTLTNLTYLDLADNQLTELNDGVFSSLSQLGTLYLEQNSLESLPKNIFQHQTSLTALHLHTNKLGTLPERLFSQLSNLDYLDISRNQLDSIPFNIFTASAHLLSLSMHTNLLTTLPENVFQQLTALNELDISNNRLTTLQPTIFSSLPDIRVLTLRNNFLSFDDFTSEIFWSAFEYLDDLQIGDNPHLVLNANHLPSTISSLFADKIQEFIPPTNASRFPELNLLDIDQTPFAFDVVRDMEEFLRYQTRLNHLAIGGFRGFFEVSQQLPSDERLFCSDDNPFVNVIKITQSAFTNLTLCSQIVRVGFLDLSDNPVLKRVELNEANRAQLQRSPALLEISATSIRLLDISGTNVAYTDELCHSLGSISLTLSNLGHPTFQYPTSEMGSLLKDCIQNVAVLDVSDTAAFRDPHFMNSILSRSITFAKDCTNADSSCDKSDFRSTVPVIIADGHNYHCDLVQGRKATTDYFGFECGCIHGFKPKQGGCANQRLTAIDVVIIAFSIVQFFIIVVAVVMWRYRRRLRFTKREHEASDLEKNLLLEYQAQDLEVLKQAWEINVCELCKIRKLDEGAFGEVWTCEWGTITVAVKFLKYSSKELGGLAQDYANDFRKEADFLQRTRNPHVVRFFGAGTDQWGSPFIVLEYISLGSLRSLLDKGLANVLRQFNNDTLRSRMTSTSSTSMMYGVGDAGSTLVDDDDHDEANDTTPLVTHDLDGLDAVLVDDPRTPRQLRHKLTHDVALGMDFLHTHGILHRDLKSGNVLVTKRLQAKLTDFGSISRHLRGVHDGDEQHDDAKLKQLRYSKAIGMKSLSATSEDAVGTPLYMAPEVLMSGSTTRRTSEKTDVFSFGVLLWEVATEKVPDLVEQEIPGYHGPLLLQLHSLMMQGRRLKFPDELQSDPSTSVDGWYKKLYDECVSTSAEDRPCFNGVLDYEGWSWL